MGARDSTSILERHWPQGALRPRQEMMLSASLSTSAKFNLRETEFLGEVEKNSFISYQGKRATVWALALRTMCPTCRR